MSNPLVTKVIKQGGVQMLPTGNAQPPTPSTSRSSTPSNKIAPKKSVRFIVQQPSCMENNIIELEPIEGYEIALYQVELESLDTIKGISVAVLCTDDLDPISLSLKNIEIGSFSVLLSNQTGVKRNIKLSYLVTFG